MKLTIGSNQSIEGLTLGYTELGYGVLLQLRDRNKNKNESPIKMYQHLTENAALVPVGDIFHCGLSCPTRIELDRMDRA